MVNLGKNGAAVLAAEQPHLFAVASVKNGTAGLRTFAPRGVVADRAPNGAIERGIIGGCAACQENELAAITQQNRSADSAPGRRRGGFLPTFRQRENDQLAPFGGGAAGRGQSINGAAGRINDRFASVATGRVFAHHPHFRLHFDGHRRGGQPLQGDGLALSPAGGRLGKEGADLDRQNVDRTVLAGAFVAGADGVQPIGSADQHKNRVGGDAAGQALLTAEAASFGAPGIPAEIDGGARRHLVLRRLEAEDSGLGVDQRELGAGIGFDLVTLDLFFHPQVGEAGGVEGLDTGEAESHTFVRPQQGLQLGEKYPIGAHVRARLFDHIPGVVFGTWGKGDAGGQVFVGEGALSGPVGKINIEPVEARADVGFVERRQRVVRSQLADVFEAQDGPVARVLDQEVEGVEHRSRNFERNADLCGVVDHRVLQGDVEDQLGILVGRPSLHIRVRLPGIDEKDLQAKIGRVRQDSLFPRPIKEGDGGAIRGLDLMFDAG